MKVTDEMVRRALIAHPHEFGISWGTMKGVLQAALNAPPAEPEIRVTEGMWNAGRNAVRRLDATNMRAAARGATVVTYSLEADDAEIIYKSMERQRLKEDALRRDNGKLCLRRGEGHVPNERSGRGRRKGDPT